MSSTATTWRTEHFHDRCSVTWDAQAQAGYAHTNPNPDAFAVDRTIEVRPGLHADLDKWGCVCGVETIGHEVTIADLLAVLRHSVWAGPDNGRSDA